jgi:DNA repair protein RadD
MLRDYQQRAIDHLYDWFLANDGDPCLVLPTGAGKSHVIAALCKDALQSWPSTRVMMLTHVKELIEQNAEKMLQHWPNAPLGIYSASVGKRQLGEPITFAGIMSVRRRASQIGHIDLVIVDEAHLINHKDSGAYRELIRALRDINPSMRVIGLTATPYRLGHGYITDKPALFDALIEPVTIEELVLGGYLAPLRSKVTKTKLDTSGVHTRGGEFIESELQAAVNVKMTNEAVVDEVMSRAGARRAWLFFCSGVEHAENIAQILRDRGVPAECIHGETPKAERERILAAYKAGRLKALTNANVLTTGFDYPDIDLIAMVRPTKSTGLYMQMAGRGMRLKSHTDHCLVLDFAGVIEMHGPVTAVNPPRRKGEEGGEAPVKVCDSCGELCHISLRVCPTCGSPFPEPESKGFKLHNIDIMGIEGQEIEVQEWKWRKHVSRTSGKDMLAVTYYGLLSDPPITEYLPVTHDGPAGQRAIAQLMRMARDSGVDSDQFAETLEEVAQTMNNGSPPRVIEFRRDGKFFRVLKREWAHG